MSATTPLEQRLVASITLANARGRLRGLIEELQEINPSLADDVRSCLQLLERLEREWRQ